MPGRKDCSAELAIPGVSIGECIHPKGQLTCFYFNQSLFVNRGNVRHTDTFYLIRSAVVFFWSMGSCCLVISKKA